MGLFDFLFGGKRSSVEVIDRVWLTNEARRAGVEREVSARSRDGAAGVLLVAHFPDTLDALPALPNDPDMRLETVLAKDLTSNLVADWPLDGESRLDIVVAERHPLASWDDRIVQFAEELPCRCRIAFHLSLEDPLMQAFSGDWLEPMLRQLGMREDEAIESSMVTRRIRAAQQQLESRTFGATETRSAVQWFAENAPETQV